MINEYSAFRGLCASLALRDLSVADAHDAAAVRAANLLRYKVKYDIRIELQPMADALQALGDAFLTKEQGQVLRAQAVFRKQTSMVLAAWERKTLKDLEGRA